jgi:PAS domain-containing protein
MDLTAYFRSVLEQDTSAVVLCNLAHEIIYMNPSAVARYARYGGAALLGKA